MGARTTTIRTTIIGSVLSGVLNKPIRPGEVPRALLLMQLELFSDAKYNGDIALEDLFEAYFTCRKNKRKTAGSPSAI
jgi:hypothetical protein